MTTDPIGIYNFPLMRRGDTFRARNIARFTQNAAPLEITAALLQVRERGRKSLVHEWSTESLVPTITITGAGLNTVTLGEVGVAITKTWPPGSHVYDLEVTFASDDASLTLISGDFPITADTSIPTT